MVYPPTKVSGGVTKPELVHNSLVARQEHLYVILEMGLQLFEYLQYLMCTFDFTVDIVHPGNG